MLAGVASDVQRQSVAKWPSVCNVCQYTQSNKKGNVIHRRPFTPLDSKESADTPQVWIVSLSRHSSSERVRGMIAGLLGWIVG
ncbi:hypothetical protein R3I94_018657 [Phoxinus phoxinus]